MLLRPYYDDGLAVIFCGDCREILPQLPPVDLLLTDPPYGIGYDARGGGGSMHSLSKAKRTQFHSPTVIGDSQVFDPSYLLGFGGRQMIWGAHHFYNRLPPGGRLLVWKKRESKPGTRMCFADGEICWDSDGGLLRILSHAHNGFVRNLGDQKKPVHPTQKPLRVMSWCLEFAPHSETIVDPYMGSGSTLVACKMAGRKSYGIEIEEHYCMRAAERLKAVTPPL